MMKSIIKFHQFSIHFSHLSREQKDGGQERGRGRKHLFTRLHHITMWSTCYNVSCYTESCPTTSYYVTLHYMLSCCHAASRCITWCQAASHDTTLHHTGSHGATLHHTTNTMPPTSDSFCCPIGSVMASCSGVTSEVESVGMGGGGLRQCHHGLP